MTVATRFVFFFHGGVWSRSHYAKFERGNTDKYTFWRRVSENVIYNLNKYKHFINTLFTYWYLFYFRTITAEITWSFFFRNAHGAWCHSSLFRPWVLHNIIKEPPDVATETCPLIVLWHIHRINTMPDDFYYPYTRLFRSPEFYWGHKSWHFLSSK